LAAFHSVHRKCNCVCASCGAAAKISVADVEAQAALIAGASVFITQLEQPMDAAMRALQIARAAGVRGVAMPDAAVARAMRLAFERLKLVLEPSGAVALAAVVSGAIPVQGRNVLIFATGGNVALDRFVALVGAA
jgi:threonine dehydratase